MTVVHIKHQPLPIMDTTQSIPIYMICQFYNPSSSTRLKEIQMCLQKNVANSFIHKIILLNERTFSDTELGISSPKIDQRVIGKRLTYKDVFDFVDSEQLDGYIVFINSDIILTDDIQLILKSPMHEQKIMLALLRYDLQHNNIIRLFGPRINSQDTWIYHSRFNPTAKQRTAVFDFSFGKLGCDNRVIFFAALLGFTIINCPDQIKTIHVHGSNERTYTVDERLPPPYAFVYPPQISIGANEIYGFAQNDRLRQYIETSTKPFVIPRIAVGTETTGSFISHLIQKQIHTQRHINMLPAIKQVLKRNAGIHITSLDDLFLYSKLYFQSFEHSEMYSVWEPWSYCYKILNQTHDFITNTYKKEHLSAHYGLEPYFHIHSNPWTRGLRGKRVLIISAFADSIQNQIPVREHIYGVDLFPECELIVCKPPQTQGTMPSKPFHEELALFMEQVNAITFDIALVSCGGYGNLVCDAIYQSGRSAIYVGGVLQMYFGIIGGRWEREKQYILDLYKNEYWIRPKSEERPSGFEQIEDGCYW